MSYRDCTNIRMPERAPHRQYIVYMCEICYMYTCMYHGVSITPRDQGHMVYLHMPTMHVLCLSVQYRRTNSKSEKTAIHKN